MVVISGIIAAAKIAVRVAPYAFRAGKITYQAAKKTKHGAAWIRRHPKAVKYGTAAAGVGTLLLDLTNIDYSAIPTAKIRTPTVKQTRDNVYSTGSRQFNNANYRSCYRYRRRR